MNPLDVATQKSSFFDIIFRDLSSFFSRFFGSEYRQKNNFSHKQKTTILTYLFNKNYYDLSKPKQTFYKETSLSSGMREEEIDNFLANLTEIEHYNRIFLIASFAECVNKVSMTGFLFDFFKKFMKENRIFYGNSLFCYFMGQFIQKYAICKENCNCCNFYSFIRYF